ncbi:thiamine phosphate synthase [Staphylococcus canis]|uniref:Thiamine phosphate synthase n=1 Tax=Staphylococcus canis TaxID=2724942 RepID=A0ABS0T5E6_9STAP|nr:thiamine phosphate synthase [Staphylococcus canis]MBI5973988.1 thiamine phosphate synthase [Staphylococcus canis]
MILAVTPFQQLNEMHIQHLNEIESLIDGVILRTPMSQEVLFEWVNMLTRHGFPIEKVIIHSDVELALNLGVKWLHFREMDATAFKVKSAYPHLTISMSVHRVASIQQALHNHIDYGVFGHLFMTPSKPNQEPRSPFEVQRALDVGLPLIAIGGIDKKTVQEVPQQFSGIAAIGSVFNASYREVERLRQHWLYIKEG